jgi:hypothetical protein
MVFEGPPSPQSSPLHKRGERKKGTGQATVKINWFLISVPKIAFLPVTMTKIWINGELGY